jgi:hypothetical protein
LANFHQESFDHVFLHASRLPENALRWCRWRPLLLWLRVRRPGCARGEARELPWETSTCCRRWCGLTETRHANSPAGSRRQRPAGATQSEKREASSSFAVYCIDISGMLNAAKMVHTFGTYYFSTGGRVEQANYERSES